MTFWWLGGHSHTTPTTPVADGAEFDNSAADNLVGLWDFSDGNSMADTGLDDGIAQDGHMHGDASTSGNALHVNGCGYFDTSGNDTPFDLNTGTVMVQFTQDAQVGSSPDTIVSRGEYCDRDSEGYFNIQVTAQGAVTVFHDSGAELSLSTDNGFFSTGDDVRVAYSWDTDGEGTFTVENVTTGATHTETFDSAGLDMDIGDNDDENFTFGAREYDDGAYDEYFNGQIDYVAIFSEDVISSDGEGIVEGTDGDDLIDTAYTGDPDGDMVDNNDALLPGEVGDDDIILGFEGDDTILAGEGNDEVYGGADDDIIDGGAGDDVIYGDGDANSVTYSAGTFSWADQDDTDYHGSGTVDNGENIEGETFVDTSGGVTVTVTTPEQSATGVETDFSTNTINDDGLDDPIDDNSSAISLAQGGESGTYSVDFSAPVENVEFNVTDIDANLGQITVVAYDVDGNQIPVDFDIGSGLGQSGNTVTADSTYNADPSADSNTATISIEGPVASFEIIHTNPGTGTSGIHISDVNYDVPSVDTSGADNMGDDTISGGAGDDIIYGDNGDNLGVTGTGVDGQVATPLDIDFSNIQAGSDTSGGDNAQTGDSVIYTNVATLADGTIIDARLVLVETSDDSLHVDLSYTSNYDLELNGNNDASMDGETATFRLEFFDPATGQPVAIDSSLVFGDIDGRDDGETVSLDTDQLTGYGTQSPTTLTVSNDGTTVAANGDVMTDDFNSDATQFGVTFEDTTDLTFTLTVGATNSGFNFHDTDPSEFDITPVGPTSSDEGGNDIIMGNDGDDILYGEGGDDTLTGGEGADEVYGGSGADIIIGGNAGDVVDGGSAGDDNDTLDLSASGPLRVVDETTDDDGNSTSGTIEFLDDTGNVTGTMEFTEIENLILPSNAGPNANDDDATVDEDSTVIIDVLGNDTDPNGDPLTVTSATSPDGDVTINPDGTLSFEPNDNFNGPTTITYTVDDGNGGTDTATVDVDVTPVNDAPDAVNDDATTAEDTPVTIDVLGNDTDVDGDTLIITGATVPTDQGTVDIVGGELVFTPADDFNGPATISYSIEDGNGGTDTATVTVNVTPVNDDPVAVDDAIDTDEDTAVVIDLVGNDTDVDGDPLTIGTVSVDPALGEVVDNGDGTATFTPADDYNGPVTIDYTVVDGQGGEDAGQAIVNVGAVNDGPTANDDDDTTDEDTAITVDLTANDTDPDGDTLTVTGASVPSDQGTLVDNGDGTVTFTPAENFNGEATISYSITDNNGGTSSAEHTVNVTPVNDDPVAVDDIETTDEDQPIVIDLIGNDTDVDGDPLTIGSVSVDPALGEVVDNGDGTVTFTPAQDYNGPVTIDYTVVDGNGGEDAGQAIVSVGAVNDAPVANDDEDTTDEDTSITVDLIGNDTDPDGDTLEVINATVPADQGTLIDNGDGTVTFTPADDFNGEATISYEISDGNGGTDTGVHTVNVTPVDDAPVTEDDTATTPEDTPVTIDVLDNDTDPDGQPLTISDASVPADQGTVEIVGNELVFTPADDFNGEATITYTAQDPDGNETPGTVTVDVTPVNDDPVAVDDVASVPFEEPVIIDVLDNDTDVDGDTLEVLGVPTADHGTVAVNPDGTLLYTPDAGYDGPDTITYTVSDGNGGTDIGEVAITVEASPLDGIVQGTDGDDLIDVTYTDDPQGDMIDAGDAILPTEVGDDDIILAGDGNDTIEAGLGDDEAYGEDGDDTINGDAGDDYLSGGEGDDTLYGGEGDDTLDAGQGSDRLYGEDGDDVLLGGPGTDLLDGGAGDDTMIGGSANDTIVGGDGSDTAYGNDGNDVIDTSGPNSSGVNASPDIGYPGLYPADTDPNDDIDSVWGGAGDDTISTGDDADYIDGGTGDDMIDGGIDDDTIDGGDGNDTIIGGEGNDTIDAGAGDDTVYGGLDPSFPDVLNIPDDGTGPFGPDLVTNNGMDVIHGGDGNDTIYGQDDNDELYGDAGDDYIDGGIDDDTIDGGTGDDTLVGGQGADVLSGGDDRDTFIVDTAEDGFGDVIDGGDGGDDFDTLDLTGSGPINVVYTSPDNEDGYVEFLDGVGGSVTDTLAFTEIENVIPCFTPGTLIATPKGEVDVATLSVGDKVITRDNGLQTIRWVGEKALSAAELMLRKELCPVMIRQGALGNGLPERDMMVSPNHRMLIASEKAALYFDDHEVLVAAKYLTKMDGVELMGAQGVTYIHVMFDRHEVILGDGTWSESFQPGDFTLAGIGEDQREEIFSLFPELRQQSGRGHYETARRVLRKHEAELLVS